MAKHHLDENHLEELLRNMPKLNDHRSSEEIYRNVKMGFNKKKKAKKSYLIPALSVIAAAIVFVLISPIFSQQNNSKSKSVGIVSNKDVSVHDIASTSSTKIEKSKQVKINLLADRVQDSKIKKTAVYEQDAKGNNIFTYGVFTVDSEVVPISIVSPKTNDDWATKYKQIALTFASKEKHHLDNYLPLHGKLTYDRNTKKVTIVIIKNALQSISEQVQLNLDRIVQYSFAYQDVKEVDFTDENGKPIELSEIGQVGNKMINKTPHTAFFSYKASNGESYLLPTDEQYPKLQDALEAMKTKPDDFHLPVIPKNLHIKVKVNNGTQATVQFTDNLHLQSIENSMNMIEGILLTAKNFGFTSVFFDHIEPLQWNGFDFTKSVKVPVAPNRINFE
jgi:hypothetical protein